MAHLWKASRPHRRPGRAQPFPWPCVCLPAALAPRLSILLAGEIFLPPSEPRRDALGPVQNSAPDDRARGPCAVSVPASQRPLADTKLNSELRWRQISIEHARGGAERRRVYGGDHWASGRRRLRRRRLGEQHHAERELAPPERFFDLGQGQAPETWCSQQIGLGPLGKLGDRVDAIA